MKTLLLLISLFAACVMHAAVAPDIVQSVKVGESFTLTVTADGTIPFSIQWWKDGKPIAGATIASLKIANPQAADAGTYACHITNSSGATDSNNAKITVTAVVLPPTNAVMTFSKP